MSVNIPNTFPIQTEQHAMHKLLLHEKAFGDPLLANDEHGDEETGLDLKQIWRVLRQRMFTILIIALLVFAAAAFKTLTTQPIYRATAKLQIDSDKSVNVLTYDVEAQPNNTNDKDFYQTQYELLQSRSLARRVIDELNLYPQLENSEPNLVKLFFADTWTQIKTFIFDKEQTVESKPVELGEYPIEDLFLSGLTVEPVKNSRLVLVHYNSTDPAKSVQSVNTLTKHFINTNLERRVESTTYAKDFLEEQLVLTKSRLEESETKLVAYAKEKQIINLGEKNQDLSFDRLVTLHGALTAAEQKRIATESLFRQSRSGDKAAFLTANLDTPAIQTIKQNHAALEAEYQEKLQFYQPEYPLMQELNEKIKALQGQLNKEIATAKDGLEAQYLAAKQEEDALRKELEQQKNTTLDIRDKSIRYNTLEREVETNRNLYEGLLQRIKEVGVAGNIEKNNITIIDSAILPFKKFSPNTQKELQQGVLLGIFLGVAVAFLLEFLDDRLKSKDDLERLLKIPVIGLIPRAKGKDTQSVALLSHSDPRSALGEAYRSVRTNLLFATREGAPKILQVTSALPSEGKSSTATNLATTFAQAGKKILLVDCDLRKPVLHQRFKLENTEGMSNFLTMQAEAVKLIRSTEISNVYIITSGPLSPNPAELLLSERMGDLLKLVPTEFDMIILDSPPIMGLADALILSNWASATLLVTAFGESRKKPLQDAFQRLKHVNAHVLGTLITKVKSGGGGYGYHYNYDYHYTYGTDKSHKKAQKFPRPA